MRTLQISNGDIKISDEGTTNFVTFENKSAQDVAHALLTEFRSFFAEGNQLLNLALSQEAFGLSESLVTQYLSEAINRLIAKQQAAGMDSRILSILDLRTRVVGLTTVVFYVEVLVDNGSSVSVTDVLSLEQTQLNHILNTSSLIKV